MFFAVDLLDGCKPLIRRSLPASDSSCSTGSCWTEPRKHKRSSPPSAKRAPAKLGSTSGGRRRHRSDLGRHLPRTPLLSVLVLRSLPQWPDEVLPCMDQKVWQWRSYGMSVEPVLTLEAGLPIFAPHPKTREAGMPKLHTPTPISMPPIPPYQRRSHGVFLQRRLANHLTVYETCCWTLHGSLLSATSFGEHAVTLYGLDRQPG